MLNLKHLYYYHIFARELSTTRAAKILRITSPALSNQLKQLEEFLGVALTQRIGGKVVVTEQGEMVQHYADRMFSAYKELNTKLSHTHDLKGGHFRAGICWNLGAGFSFDMLSLMEKSSLSLSKSIHITFDSSERLLADFIKGQLDLVLGAFTAETATPTDGIHQSLSFPVKLFAPQVLHSLGDGKKECDLNNLGTIIKLAHAHKISLVFPMAPSVLRNETEAFLSRLKIHPLKTIECNSTSAIVQLIERGLAMGFVPTPCLLDFKSAESLTVLGPSEGYWSHNISVFLLKGQQKSTVKKSELAELFSPESKFN